MANTEIWSMTKNLSTIQALRGIAALLILLIHTSSYIPFTHGKIYGFIGVDIFFVISGFIMVYTSWDKLGTKQYGLKFLKNRAIRIYSNYWLVLIILLGLYFTDILKFSQNPDFISSFTLINQPLANQLLPVAWTLTHEIFFYIIFTITFFIARRHFLIFLLTWAFILAMAAILIERKKGITSPIIAFYLSPLHLEFIIGCMVGYLIRSKKYYYPALSFIIGLSAIIITIYITQDAPLKGWENTIWRAIFYGGGSGIMIYGLTQLEIIRNISAPKYLIALGNSSYSLYLVHLPIIMILPLYIHGWALPYLLIIIPITYSLLHHKYLEAPLLKILKKLSK